VLVGVGRVGVGERIVLGWCYKAVGRGAEGGGGPKVRGGEGEG